MATPARYEPDAPTVPLRRHAPRAHDEALMRRDGEARDDAAREGEERRDERPYEPEARRGVTKLVFGIVLVVAVVALGMVAKLAGVTDFQRWFDRRIALYERSGELTTVARKLSEIVTPEYVGIGALVLIPLVLLLLRRRFAALQALCVMGGALALAFVVKRLVDEHRPPTALWAMQADHTPSYPSGHTTVAAAIVVTLLVVIGSTAWRSLVAVVGVVFVLAVAASRVYLANHYPLDVVGSMLVALAAGFVVAGLAALPPIHRRLRRWDRPRR